jgi:hypothetical protein
MEKALPENGEASISTQEGDGCTHDGSKLAFFRTSIAQPQLRTRASRNAQPCTRMLVCRLNAVPPTRRTSRLLFPGTLTNARGACQMPIRHRGHAGLRRAGQDAPCPLRAAPEPSPCPQSMGQCADLPAGISAFDRPFASGECAMVPRSAVALPAKARRNLADIGLLEPIDADETAGFANVNSRKFMPWMRHLRER